MMEGFGGHGEESGRVAASGETGSSSLRSPEPGKPVSAHSGNDPARERVRVILDCEWGDLQHALDMVVDAKPMFDGVPDRPGWGWHWSRQGKTPLFVRRTKRGYSATADRPGSDT